MRQIFAAVCTLSLAAAAGAQVIEPPDLPGPPQTTVINVDDQDYILTDTLYLTANTEINVYGGAIKVNASIVGNGADGAHGASGEACVSFPVPGGQGRNGYNLVLRTFPSRSGAGLPAGDIEINQLIELKGGAGGNGGEGTGGGWFYDCDTESYVYCVAQSGARGGNGGAGGNFAARSGGKLLVRANIDATGGSAGSGGNGGGYSPFGRTGTSDTCGSGGAGGAGGRGGSIQVVQVGAPVTEDCDFAIYGTLISNGGDGGPGGSGGVECNAGGFAGAGGAGGRGGGISISSATEMIIGTSCESGLGAGAESVGGDGGSGGNGGGSGGGLSFDGECGWCGPPMGVLDAENPCGQPGVGHDPCDGSVGRRGGVGGVGGGGAVISVTLTNAAGFGLLNGATFRCNGGSGGDAGDTPGSGNVVYANCDCDGLPSEAATAGAAGGAAGQITISGGGLYVMMRNALELLGGLGGDGGAGGENGPCDGCTTPGEQGGAGGNGGAPGTLTFNVASIYAGENDITNVGGNGGDGHTGSRGSGPGGLGGAAGGIGVTTLTGTVSLLSGYGYTFAYLGSSVPGQPGGQGQSCGDGSGS